MNLVSEFQDDPTVNESGIIILLEQVWVYAKKIEDFGSGRRENEFERKIKGRNIF